MTKFIYAGTTYETDQDVRADTFTQGGYLRVQTTDGGRYVFTTGPGIAAVVVEVEPPTGSKIF